MLQYRLGLDMGTNSLGWYAVHIRKDGSPIAMLDWGVRIFDDGRKPAKKEVPGESSAVQRRTARGMRRRYDRKQMRKKATLRELIKAGLMPEDKEAGKKLETMEPLKLRSDAISSKLDNPYKIGRALFHLQQRRGFKSNRKESRSNSESVSPMKKAGEDLELLLIGKTLGQYLYERNKQRQTTRFHARKEGSKTLYDFYPTRKLVEEEFSTIWEAQRKHHPALLTEEARTAIHKAIFYQRPLKPQPKGNCSIIITEERMAWAMPTAQHFRIAKEIANLRIQRPDDNHYKGEELEKRQLLSPEQRKKLFDALCSQGSMTFKQIRKLLKLDSTTSFNMETTHRDKLDGDKTAASMRSGKKKGEVFPGWDDLMLEEQDIIIGKFLCDDEKDPNYMEDEALTQWLVEQYHLTPQQAEKVVDAPLPSGYAKFGTTIISETLPKMRDDGMMEYAALRACNRDPGDQFTGELVEKLPYYGALLEGHVVKNEKSSDLMVREYGRVGNPTVHIALNQLRRLMNTLKDRYGCWPQEIVIELARGLKKGRTEVAEIIKEIDKNTKLRDKWRKEIAENLGIEESAVSDDDLAKMKLWYELEGDATHRKCVFSGEMISLRDLLSDKIEIEHILPRSQTLDNTAANKTLATREANRRKDNRTPYDAFKDATGEYAYEKVWERAQILPKSKRWRFLPDAMEKFVAKGDFAARQLNDTSYISRLARKYLAYACEQGKDGVQATPGTLTGLLRKAWGLNNLLGDDGEKNRNDHRHHAVDALVIAMTTRSMVKSVADAAKKEEAQKGTRLVSHIPQPWPEFEWSDLKQRVDKIVVSHKPDHGTPAQATGGTSGRLHEDTYYGYVGEGEKKGAVQLVLRVTLLSLKNAGELADIRDKQLRETLQQFVYDFDGSFEEALKAFIASNNHAWKGIHNVRVLVEKSRDSMIPLKKRENGAPWKMVQGGSNQRAEIYCPKSGKKAGKWQMEVIKAFDANQKDFVPQWRLESPDAELVMTLHSNDMVAYDEEGKPIVSRVRKLNSIGQVVFVEPRRAKLENAEGWVASANQLQLKNARRLYVEIDGSIYDPHGVLTTTHSLPEAAA